VRVGDPDLARRGERPEKDKVTILSGEASTTSGGEKKDLACDVYTSFPHSRQSKRYCKGSDIRLLAAVEKGRWAESLAGAGGGIGDGWKGWRSESGVLSVDGVKKRSGGHVRKGTKLAESGCLRTGNERSSPRKVNAI